MTNDLEPGTRVRSDIPSRLDALRWSRWHRRVVLALGITWILDGLEASLIANIAPTTMAWSARFTPNAISTLRREIATRAAASRRCTPSTHDGQSNSPALE